MVAKLTVAAYQRRTYPSDLMDQVLGILDSKIQYQEFKINQAVKSYVDLQPMKSNNSQIKESEVFAPILENNARVLENIDQASHLIKLLYIIRKRLSHGNAKIVLDIISEKKFERFTAQGIKDYFDRPWMRKTEIA